MNRIAMLPELQFAEDIKGLQRDLETIKTAQRVGKDILRPKIVQTYEIDGVTPTEYDFEVPDASSYLGVPALATSFRVTYTSETQENPFAVIQYQLRKQGNVPLTAEEASYLLADSELDVDYILPHTLSFYSPTGNGIWINTADSGVTELYVKVFVHASDRGSLQIKLWNYLANEPT